MRLTDSPIKNINFKARTGKENHKQPSGLCWTLNTRSVEICQNTEISPTSKHFFPACTVEQGWTFSQCLAWLGRCTIPDFHFQRSKKPPSYMFGQALPRSPLNFDWTRTKIYFHKKYELCKDDPNTALPCAALGSLLNQGLAVFITGFRNPPACCSMPEAVIESSWNCFSRLVTIIYSRNKVATLTDQTLQSRGSWEPAAGLLVIKRHLCVVWWYPVGHPTVFTSPLICFFGNLTAWDWSCHYSPQADRR